jgi:3-methyladenine DNA glycosylase AlkD
MAAADPTIADFMQACIKSAMPYRGVPAPVLRTAIRHHLPGGHCHQELLASVIEDNLDGSTRTTPALSPYGREFVIRKAIGWALRDHARTDPEWVLGFVADHEAELCGPSRREALKHLPGG